MNERRTAAGRGRRARAGAAHEIYMRRGSESVPAGRSMPAWGACRTCLPGSGRAGGAGSAADGPGGQSGRTAREYAGKRGRDRAGCMLSLCVCMIIGYVTEPVCMCQRLELSVRRWC